MQLCQLDKLVRRAILVHPRSPPGCLGLTPWVSGAYLPESGGRELEGMLPSRQSALATGEQLVGLREHEPVGQGWPGGTRLRLSRDGELDSIYLEGEESKGEWSKDR